MSSAQAKRFFEFLLADDAESLDCAAIADQVHRYVDLHVSGRRMDVLMPGVAAHLESCVECRDLFDCLAELAWMEAGGDLPSTEALWLELAGMTGRAGGLGAAAAIAGASQPARPVPVPSGAAIAGAAGGSGWTRWRRILLGRRQDLALAVAGLAVLVLAAGWWSTDRSSREDETTISAIASTSQIAFRRAASGAWAKVFFGPGLEEAVLHVGDMPVLRDGQRLECWLKRRDGPAKLAAAFERLDGDEDWWVIDADQPLESFQSLALSINDNGASRSLVEVPLAAASR